MGVNESKLLMTVEDRIIAEDIQRILEEYEIYTILNSDNPAFSIIGTYGMNPIENIDIRVNTLDVERAIEILNESPYKGLIN